ncbi:hypothetical protein GCM10009777_19290 [Microbacterium pumilum]|uniref:AbiEi antitoxin C-terminal domain-containing protein n=1 Tax=Microbacterium pumilum TaxID=344165 RepID=A0ABN2SEP9_9MICO
MTLTVDLPIEVVRRRHRADPFDDRRLRAAIRAGAWTRVTSGAFVRTAEWQALSPTERHRVRVLEVMRRMRAPAVVSHFAAAALWDIDVLGDWPASIDVSCAPARGGRSSGAIRRHPRILDGVDVQELGDHSVTAPVFRGSLPTTHHNRANSRHPLRRSMARMTESTAHVKPGRTSQDAADPRPPGGYQLTGSALPSS